MRRVREYLVEAHARNVSLEDLGKLANLSPYHLHRVFTREVGMPPHAFQTQVRISRARILLNEGKPLHMAAAERGFADQSHFTREFKRYVGLTPGAYRCSRQPSSLVGMDLLPAPSGPGSPEKGLRTAATTRGG